MFFDFLLDAFTTSALYLGCAKTCLVRCVAEHFVEQNVRVAKMHLVQKCIWCVAKMHFCVYFVEQKCSATNKKHQNKEDGTLFF